MVSTWLRRVAAAVWLAAIGLWIQFAVSSVDELEVQAGVLGAIVAAILLAGGLTIWAAGRRAGARKR